ncbi:unnamed protein product [Linum trigynum]|uniref:Uncharacterized protein n=1 Tax=Linum trigynum TaxID=586398 RepID=A0AAV2EWI7_9ROSI
MTLLQSLNDFAPSEATAPPPPPSPPPPLGTIPIPRKVKESLSAEKSSISSTKTQLWTPSPISSSKIDSAKSTEHSSRSGGGGGRPLAEMRRPKTVMARGLAGRERSSTGG